MTEKDRPPDRGGRPSWRGEVRRGALCPYLVPQGRPRRHLASSVTGCEKMTKKLGRPPVEAGRNKEVVFHGRPRASYRPSRIPRL
jgi:hypothetical protein